MALRHSSLPAWSDRRRDPVHDGFKCKYQKASTLGLSASETDDDAALDGLLWRFLPAELLDLVILRLPFAARCRFRCVCRKWMKTPFVAPPCTIVSRLGGTIAKFFCDSEKKWYSLPSNSLSPPDWTWEVVDVEGGLVCYQGEKNHRYWLWVCNPLDPSRSRLIAPDYYRRGPPPYYPYLYPPVFKAEPPVTKLVVDRARKAFRVIVLLCEPGWTAVYDSTTSYWHVSHDSPGYRRNARWNELFVRDNDVFAYIPKWTVRLNRIVSREVGVAAALSMETGRWDDVEAALPSEFPFPTYHFFQSGAKQMMVVLFSYRNRPRPYFSVWKCLAEGSGNADVAEHGSPIAKWEKWVQICMDIETVTMELVDYRMADACSGCEHIWLTFVDDGEDGSKRGPKCLRYSFQTKKWIAVPWSGGAGRGRDVKMYSWEASFDVYPS